MSKATTNRSRPVIYCIVPQSEILVDIILWLKNITEVCIVFNFGKDEICNGYVLITGCNLVVNH